MKIGRIKENLQKAHPIVFTIYTIIAAFSTYTCMYAFRKPYTVATFDGFEYNAISLKILLLTAQVLGYTFSKYLGIKIISEMKGKNRALSIISLVLLAHIFLLFFAIVPPPYNIIFMFLNGIPLGMIWGIVISYLEGRKVTEALGAGLSISLILASGFVKSVGKILMEDFQITEFWMPFFAGLVFVVPLFVFVLMLEQMPSPTVKDIMSRTERKPMNSVERWLFFKKYASILVFMIAIYILLTMFREFRDNFAADLWVALGHGSDAKVFTTTEIPIAFVVTIFMGLIMFIKNHLKALQTILLIVFLGGALIGVSTYSFEKQFISSFWWMSLVGTGVFLGYLPYNAFIYDRFIATFKHVANVGFLIYVSDALGYTGSLGVYFYKNFFEADLSWLEFFVRISYMISVAIVLFSLLTMVMVQRKCKRKKLNSQLI